MDWSKLVDFASKNPDRVIIVALSVLAFILRFAKPGSRVQGAASSLSIDLVKFYCVLTGKPLPGGFSPAPAEISPSVKGMAHMATPIENKMRAKS